MVKTIISVDPKKPAWEQDPKTPLHNRWHPDIPAVARVKEGELFRVECRRGVLDRADGVSGRMCQHPRAQVKLVGATAHYATADLDEGPIIEQDCARISHKNSIDDLLRIGRVLEKNVLVTAVRAHVEDRIIVYESKCVVFGE